MLGRPEPREGYTFKEGRYKGQRENGNWVYGILVIKDDTRSIYGILNERTGYAELAYVKTSTIQQVSEEENATQKRCDDYYREMVHQIAGV